MHMVWACFQSATHKRAARKQSRLLRTFPQHSEATETRRSYSFSARFDPPPPQSKLCPTNQYLHLPLPESGRSGLQVLIAMTRNTGPRLLQDLRDPRNAWRRAPSSDIGVETGRGKILESTLVPPRAAEKNEACVNMIPI